MTYVKVFYPSVYFQLIIPFQVRVSDVKRGEAFLVNPFGLLFSEITAASLVKCDLEGNIIDGGTTSLGQYLLIQSKPGQALKQI